MNICYSLIFKIKKCKLVNFELEYRNIVQNENGCAVRLDSNQKD